MTNPYRTTRIVHGELTGEAEDAPTGVRNRDIRRRGRASANPGFLRSFGQ